MHNIVFPQNPLVKNCDRTLSVKCDVRYGVGNELHVPKINA